jgi:hypothetical protein
VKHGFGDLFEAERLAKKTLYSISMSLVDSGGARDFGDIRRMMGRDWSSISRLSRVATAFLQLQCETEMVVSLQRVCVELDLFPMVDAVVSCGTLGFFPFIVNSIAQCVEINYNYKYIRIVSHKSPINYDIILAMFGEVAPFMAK